MNQKMKIGPTIFNAQWNALTAARCLLRVDGRTVIERCLCGSFGLVRTDTDAGQYDAAMSSVKLMKSSWPAGKNPEGEKVEFMRVGGAEWKKYRIAGTSETDGVLNLTLEAEFA